MKIARLKGTILGCAPSLVDEDPGRRHPEMEQAAPVNPIAIDLKKEELKGPPSVAKVPLVKSVLELLHADRTALEAVVV
jgi:hypothetical protein